MLLSDRPSWRATCCGTVRAVYLVNKRFLNTHLKKFMHKQSGSTGSLTPWDVAFVQFASIVQSSPPHTCHRLRRHFEILAMFSQTRHGSRPIVDTFSGEGGCFSWDGPECNLLLHTRRFTIDLCLLDTWIISSSQGCVPLSPHCHYTPPHSHFRSALAKTNPPLHVH